MRLKGRLQRLEMKRENTRPGLIFLTAEGLKDVHGQRVKALDLEGVKIIAGIDPRDL